MPYPSKVSSVSNAMRKFISEAIKPVASSADLAAMAAGGPGLPREFRWRDQTLEITSVLRTWKETGSCRHGSGERYVRKHWYEVETGEGQIARIYFERQSRGDRFKRWWLYSLEVN